MTTSRNICFFNTTKFWGGGEKWHFEAAEMMSRTTHNCFFVCDGGGELTKKLDGLAIEQYHIKTSNLSFFNPIKVNGLVSFYRQNQIDTVIFNSPKDLKLGAKAAKRAGVKNIVYRRGIAVEVSKKRVYKDLFKNVVTHFLFNSQATKALLEKNYLDIIPTKKTAIIYNAIDFSNSINIPAGVDEPFIIIGNAGRLVEQKGQRYLIRIAKKLKVSGVRFRMQIAGEGPLYGELKALVKKEGLVQEIDLLGFVRDMKGFMDQCDIFVSTALWEGFGFVLAEAMVAKKPVIAFDLSSNPELVKDGENGYLVEPKNTDAFAKRLENLIDNKGLRVEMGSAAYDFAKANFEKEAQFNKLLDFIN